MNRRTIELKGAEADVLFDTLTALRSLVAEAVMDAQTDKVINDLTAIGLNVNAVVGIINDNTFFEKE